MINYVTSNHRRFEGPNTHTAHTAPQNISRVSRNGGRRIRGPVHKIMIIEEQRIVPSALVLLWPYQLTGLMTFSALGP